MIKDLQCGTVPWRDLAPSRQEEQRSCPDGAPAARCCNTPPHFSRYSRIRATNQDGGRFQKKSARGDGAPLRCKEAFVGGGGTDDPTLVRYAGTNLLEAHPLVRQPEQQSSTTLRVENACFCTCTEVSSVPNSQAIDCVNPTNRIDLGVDVGDDISHSEVIGQKCRKRL